MWLKILLFVVDFLHLLRPVSALIVRRGNEFLIVKKNRKEYAWQFPQGGIERGESLLEAAQRELGEECGIHLRIVFRPLSPVFHTRYFFPKNFNRYIHKEHHLGASVRFFHAEYVSGEVRINTQELEEYKWVKGEEIMNFFEKDYWQGVRKFL